MRKVVFGLLVAGSVVFTACDNAASKIEGVEETNSDAPASANDIVNDVNAASGTATFQFEEERHDFGDIAEGTVAKHTFKFTNTGDAPLIIYNAQGSCGCTVPVCDKDPIMPGATSAISVKYDTKRIGPINKSVTITSNSSNEPTKVIRIKGRVEAADLGAPSGVPVKQPATGAPTSN